MQPRRKPPCAGSLKFLKLMSQTITQMTPITLESSSPNSSSFFDSGVLSSSFPASVTASWILPISVRMPVAHTTHTAEPLATVVLLKTMLLLPCSSQSVMSNGRGSGSFCTDCDSPVSCDCSTRSVVVLSWQTLMSAGTLSPTRTSHTSPGTTSSAGMVFHLPSLRMRASSGCSDLSASSAFSALLSCHTPTMALAIRISRITSGSTYAVRPSSPLSSSTASTKLTHAANSRIRTSRSSNWSRMRRQRDLPSSWVSSFLPYLARLSAASSSVSPLVMSVLKY
mmetsp:Transcript_28004/g.69931  ORF Transcript_28004/g.69931 Transcript_28004/m.69931 type:complete len:282 (+) Transcript_28004:2986-3831(+)